MLNLYLLIEHDKIFIYTKTKNGHDLVSQYIEGSDYINYELNTIEDDISRMLNVLLDEFNLDSAGELDFRVVIDEDNLRFAAERLVKTLKNAKISVEIIDLKPILSGFISQFQNDGVNFDGNNYVIVNGRLQRRKFSIMGKTLNEKDIMSRL